MALDASEKHVLDGVNSSFLMAHTRRIGSYDRVSGGMGEREATDYVISALKADGIPMLVHEFCAFLSHPGEARVTIFREDGADGRNVPAKARAFSGSTPVGGVTGEIVLVQGGTDMFYDYDTWRVLDQMDLRGKIVVTEGGGRLNMITAQKRGAVAYVHVWPTALPGERIPEGVVNPVWGTPEPGNTGAIPEIPVVAVAKQSEHLFRPGDRVTVESKVTTGWMPVRIPVAHIAAGGVEDPEREFVLVHGHIDSWHLGGTDNATGNSACMEIARVLHQNRHMLSRDVRVAWWPGHSAGRYAGSTWYADNHHTDLSGRCAGHINIDSPGMRDASDLSQVVCASEAARFAAEVVQDVTGPHPSRVAPNRSSDQSFWGAGVPSFFLTVSRVPGGAWWWHTEDDTVATADEQNLVRDTKIYLLGAYRLATCPMLPYEFSASASELSRVIDGLGPRAGGFDLAPARKALDRFQRAAVGVEGRLRGAGEVPPVVLKALNRLLLEASRAVVRVTYTEGSEFHHDPAVPMRLLPGLADVARLASLDPAGGEAHMLVSRLVRRRNRVVAYLTGAAVALENVLGILDSEGEGL